MPCERRINKVINQNKKKNLRNKFWFFGSSARRRHYIVVGENNKPELYRILRTKQQGQRVYI